MKKKLMLMMVFLGGSMKAQQEWQILARQGVIYTLRTLRASEILAVGIAFAGIAAGFVPEEEILKQEQRRKLGIPIASDLSFRIGAGLVGVWCLAAATEKILTNDYLLVPSQRALLRGLGLAGIAGYVMRGISEKDRVRIRTEILIAPEAVQNQEPPLVPMNGHTFPAESQDDEGISEE